jgi:hypothetical protein
MGLSSGLAVIAELGDLAGIDVLNPRAGDWMILASDHSPAIIPDTVPRFEYRGEARVSDYPMEQGAFASYNKVATPFDIRMVMVCSGLNFAQNIAQTIKGATGLNIGQNLMQKPAFLDTLDYMLATTDLFSIVTPDRTYNSVNLEHYDYKRETSSGATMLIVEAWFREVRITGAATYTSGGVRSNSPSAASPVGLGTVQTSDFVTNPKNIGDFL